MTKKASKKADNEQEVEEAIAAVHEERKPRTQAEVDQHNREVNLTISMT